MSEARKQAVHLAQFYFRMIAERAGATWEGDNDVEVEIMVGHVIDAAVDRLRPALDDAISRIRQLEERDEFDGALDRIEALERQQEADQAEGARFCPETSDGLHCGHWPDGERCCACGQDGPEPEADDEDDLPDHNGPSWGVP